MIKNYFKIAFRNFWRNKLTSFINMVGLSLGLATCILITMYVSHEKTYDQFHTDADRIFKVTAKFKIGGDNIGMSRLSAVVGPQLREKAPNIDDAFRYYTSSDPITVRTSKASSEIFYEKNFLAADENLFSFFSFDLVKGNPSDVLKAPFSVVLTSETAEKYFGNVDPIGKQIIMKQDSTYQFTVTGVMKDFPTNSSIDTDLVVSMSSLASMNKTKDLIEETLFQGGSFVTFLKLNTLAQKKDIEATALQLDRSSFEESTNTYSLDPFTESYALNANTGRFDYLNVFPIVALLILFLALTNYISLTTAKASTRSKEVGVRKISGANRKSLAMQFYIESAIFVTFSFLVGFSISFLIKPYFLQLLEIEIDNAFFLNLKFIIAVTILFVFTVLVSGIYPAMVLSSFNPIENFRNTLIKNSGNGSVRKVFTTLQFSIAVLLIICGVVMSTQLDFMRSKDTGLDRSNLMIIPVEKTIQTNTAALRNNMENIAGVKETSLTQYAVYDPYNIFFVNAPDVDNSFQLITFNVDDNFINTLGVSWYLEPKERKPLIDNGKIIINEKTISEMGLLPDPRGQKLSIGNQSLEIAGVVKDFNYTSLENPIQPLAFFVNDKTTSNLYPETLGSAKIYVKYEEGTSIPNIISQLETTYKTFDTTTPFSYEFMDDTFDALYKSEEQLSLIIYAFIALALIIAGLGLFGLVTFASEQRIKEIGIRKVLGASVSEIVLLLSSDFIKLVLLAILIAVPIAWYFADSWLNYFAFRVDMPWWSFVIAGVIAITIALTTVSFQAIKAAIANPIKSLRTE